MYCHREFLEPNSFRVVRVSEEERQDIYFLASAIPTLQKFIHLLKADQKTLVTLDLKRRVIKILSDLIFFAVETENANPIECEGMEQNAKQKLMKDFRFLEIITDILYYPFKNQAYDISDLTNEDKEIVTIFKLAFRVIKHVI